MYKRHLFEASSISSANNVRLSIILFRCTQVVGVTYETTASGLGNCGLISVERYCGFMYRLKHAAMFRIITDDCAVCFVASYINNVSYTACVLNW